VITEYFVTVQCKCGGQHRLPVDPFGRIVWICVTVASSFSLQMNLKQFQAALRAKPTDQAIANEGICVVHRAGQPRELQQRCVDCNDLMLDYRPSVPLLNVKAKFWKPGELVGRTPWSAFYVTQTPMSPNREVRCFAGGRPA
jgi:hypothetical protein